MKRTKDRSGRWKAGEDITIVQKKKMQAVQFRMLEKGSVGKKGPKGNADEESMGLVRWWSEHLDDSRAELKELVMTVIKPEHGAQTDTQARINT